MRVRVEKKCDRPRRSRIVNGAGYAYGGPETIEPDNEPGVTIKSIRCHPVSEGY
jgi:hypothetical protein